MSNFPSLRILLLAPQLPYPPQQGTSVRNYHIIRGLAQCHEVHLLSFATPADAALAGPLNELCAEITTVAPPGRTLVQRLRRLASDSRPDMAHRLESAAFENALREILKHRRFDVIQIEGIELAATLAMIRRLQPTCRVVFDDHNAEAELQRRMFVTDLGTPSRWLAAAYSFIQWRRLRQFERWVCRNVDGVSVVSDADGHFLRELLPGLDPFVIPNCIDVEEYRSLTPSSGSAEDHDLLFIGKMDYRPNVDAVLWFGSEIWPLIRAVKPELTFAVVGRQPHPRLRRLAQEPGITVTGSVPQIKAYLANARVCVLPFRMGSGTRLKLIEALASGIATVSTRVGAEGYPVEHGKHLLLEDGPKEFAEAVLHLIEDDERRRQLQIAGREFAEQYDWRRIVPKFNKLYARLMQA